MKNLYINSRLHPLLVAPYRRGRTRNWIFSLGEPWLLLTPSRLARLASRLGIDDRRVSRLVGLVKRHNRRPGDFCRRLGIGEARYYRAEEYPLELCPRCDGVFYPHPEDAGAVCESCRANELFADRWKPTTAMDMDRMADEAARQRLSKADPSAFYEGRLSPNYKLNLARRLDRDWDRAINRILMGGSYREVAREFDCSVGLLHRKVKERHWENN